MTALRFRVSVSWRSLADFCSLGCYQKTAEHFRPGRLTVRPSDAPPFNSSFAVTSLQESPSGNPGYPQHARMQESLFAGTETRRCNHDEKRA